MTRCRVERCEFKLDFARDTLLGTRARRRLAQRLDLGAVCAPPSVTICSSTRTRCSSSSMRDAYCAAFSAAMPRFDLELLLAEFEEAVGDDHQHDRRQADRRSAPSRTAVGPFMHFLPCRSSVPRCRARACDGWSVTIRSSVSSRSLTEPSSARSWAFSLVSSLIRSTASWSRLGMDRHSPAVRQRIAVLDLQPGVEHRAADR